MYHLTLQPQSLLFQVASLIDLALGLLQETAVRLAQTPAS